MCNPFFCSLYMGFITIHGIATVLFSLLPVFQNPEYRNIRTFLFCGMGFSGVAPIVHKLVFFRHQPEALHTTGYEILIRALYGGWSIDLRYSDSMEARQIQHCWTQSSTVSCSGRGRSTHSLPCWVDLCQAARSERVLDLDGIRFFMSFAPSRTLQIISWNPTIRISVVMISGPLLGWRRAW